jgi:hypothetical protein
MSNLLHQIAILCYNGPEQLIAWDCAFSMNKGAYIPDCFLSCVLVKMLFKQRLYYEGIPSPMEGRTGRTAGRITGRNAVSTLSRP